MENINKRRNERLDSLLGNDHMQNLDQRWIMHLPYVVSKTRIPRKAKIIRNGDLPVKCPVIKPLEFEMIYRSNLVAEVFQGSE